MNSAVLLLSGGFDSSVMAAWMAKTAVDTYPLFVDYGQRPAQIEENFARQAAETYCQRNLAVVRVPVLSWLREATLEESPLWSNTPFPQRNLMLLTLGAMWAARVNSNAVALGIISDPKGQYPDTTSKFLSTARKMLQVSQPRLDILAPFLHLSKFQVSEKGYKLGVSPETTWSCTKNNDTPCFRCGGCDERAVIDAVYASEEARKRAIKKILHGKYHSDCPKNS